MVKRSNRAPLKRKRPNGLASRLKGQAPEDEAAPSCSKSRAVNLYVNGKTNEWKTGNEWTPQKGKLMDGKREMGGWKMENEPDGK